MAGLMAIISPTKSEKKNQIKYGKDARVTGASGRASATHGRERPLPHPVELGVTVTQVGPERRNDEGRDRADDEKADAEGELGILVDELIIRRTQKATRRILDVGIAGRRGRSTSEPHHFSWLRRGMGMDNQVSEVSEEREREREKIRTPAESN
jgi:hypothetical protein